MIVAPQVLISLPQVGARRTLTVRLTRDGEQSANLKVCRLLNMDMALLAVFGTAYQSVQTFLASAVDGDRYLFAIDEASPKRAAARYPTISEDTTFNIDLNDGSGGTVGEPATLQARVRVDGFDAAREVLAVERQTDGIWRIAGNLRTADGSLDLRVTGGAVYAMAFDDYGTLYQPNLAVAVGDVIRPSTFAGWLYRITQAGSLPASEPAWWDGNTAGPQDLGSARAEVVRYHRPLAHGPVSVEMT
ncbi:hypothetical protein E0E54_00745 [Azotobacter chroococcum]|uniref:hypothetical protein n=1 Tax=Azotobacter chroococcum TaxID=353 RepID=UPI0010401943|nr:hypothetical protein [Azotobacter chroococcum]TBW40138.1 hypothetical protein E0E54_00745 [Azotobacter chroococcum]